MLDDNGCLATKERKRRVCLQHCRGGDNQYVKNLQQQLSLNKLILPHYEMSLDNSKLSRVAEKDFEFTSATPDAATNYAI